MVHKAHTNGLAGKMLEYFVPALDHANSSPAYVKRNCSEYFLPLMQGIDSVALEGWQESNEVGQVGRSYSRIHLPFDLRNFHGFEL